VPLRIRADRDSVTRTPGGDRGYDTGATAQRKITAGVANTQLTAGISCRAAVQSSVAR